MEFIPENELERLLMAAAADPNARADFYRALTKDELYFVTEGKLPEGERRVEADAEKSFQVRMIDIDGKPYIPIFTSVTRISAVVPSLVGYAAMEGRAVLTASRGKDLILNPGAEYGKFFPPEEVESILDGSILSPQSAPHRKLDVGGQKILLAQPKDYPHHVTSALSKHFAKSRQVRKAYLAHAFLPEVDNQAHTLVGLEVDDDWDAIVEKAGVVVRDCLTPGEILDFIRLASDGSDVVHRYMRDSTTPFYTRKKWLGLF